MDAARKLLVDTLARRPDLDLKNLSLTIGRNHAYLQQYLMRGSPRELPEAARHGLAPLLGVSPDDLRSAALPMGDGRVHGDVRVAGSLRLADRGDLPVYASAEGGGEVILITSEPMDFIRRPEPLLSVRDGYACYVIGDSMSPAYEQGDLLLLHPGRPARPVTTAPTCATRRRHRNRPWSGACCAVRRRNGACASSIRPRISISTAANGTGSS